MGLFRREFLRTSTAPLYVSLWGVANDVVLSGNDIGNEKNAIDRERTAGVRDSDGRVADSHSPELPADSYAVEPGEHVEGIQEIIDEHGPNVTIRLGAGTYTGSELTLDDGVHLRGLGRNATTIELADGADTDLVVTPEVDEQALRQPMFRNLTLDGNRSNNSTGDIVYGAFWNGRFVDCDFVSGANNGVWLAGSTGGSTDDNYFRGCRFIDCAGDGLREGANRSVSPAVGVSRVESCWFGHNGGRAVRIRGNANIVANSKFYGNDGPDVFVDRGTRNVVSNNDVSKYTVEAPCVWIRATNGVDSVTNRIHGNVFDEDFRDAIYCQTDGNAIVALQVHDNNVNAPPEFGDANRSAIFAEGDRFESCSARNNTIVGEYTDAPMKLPDSWQTSGNIV